MFALITEQDRIRLALICAVAAKRIFVSIEESLEFNLPTRHALQPQSLAKLPTTDLYTPNRLFGSIATDFEQVMPRGWSFATRGVIVEVWHR